MFKYRYGIDKYSLFLVALSLPFALSKYTIVISLILITYSFYRSLSKNFVKRKNELYKFESILEKFKLKILREFTSIKNKIKYKIVICPNCSQKLRVPRFKGKLVITCKSCNYQFKFRS